MILTHDYFSDHIVWTEGAPNQNFLQEIRKKNPEIENLKDLYSIV
jgi:hypothetical protein